MEEIWILISALIVLMFICKWSGSESVEAFEDKGRPRPSIPFGPGAANARAANGAANARAANARAANGAANGAATAARAAAARAAAARATAARAAAARATAAPPSPNANARGAPNANARAAPNANARAAPNANARPNRPAPNANARPAPNANARAAPNANARAAPNANARPNANANANARPNANANARPAPNANARPNRPATMPAKATNGVAKAAQVAAAGPGNMYSLGGSFNAYDPSLQMNFSPEAIGKINMDGAATMAGIGSAKRLDGSQMDAPQRQGPRPGQFQADLPGQPPLVPASQMQRAPQGGQGGQAGQAELHMVYGDWCGHSKRALPEYEKLMAKGTIKTSDGTSVAIKKTTDKDPSMDQFKSVVKGFPTYILKKDGKMMEVNNHDRTAKKLEEVVSQM